LMLNYPLPLVAVLPVALAVSVVRFSGTISLSFLPSPSPSSSDSPPSPSPTTLAFSFLPDYRLDLSVRSLLGSRSRLQDVPKLAQLVEARIHSWLQDRCVEPRYQQIVLPSIWPRRRNTRGGEDEEVIEDEEEAGMETETETEARPSVQDNKKEKSTSTTPNYKEGSLEARMAEEGRKILAAEGRALPQQAGNEGPRKRNVLQTNQSTENFKIPGRFQS